MDENVSFGYWLRRRRKALDLTQLELARRVGCALGTIRKLEADERRPSQETAVRLAQILEVPSAERAAFLKVARAEVSADRLAVASQPVVSADQLTPPSRPTLPVPSTPLIGRAQEVATVCILLQRAEVRLLTLIGPGGIGKTRLGLQVAVELREAFPDGVVFVPLAPLSDPTLVAATIAQTLKLKASSGQPLVERLQEYLSAKQLLLVLDNFEQVGAAAPLLGALLAASPHLTVLVTSRTPLHLSGEHEFLVPPLALPDPKQLPPLERLKEYEAVRLFSERARAVKSGFVLTGENARAVAEICAHLDGLPLAIELAAARIKLLSPQALLARLTGAHRDSPLHLLTGGPVDQDPKHRTLRATIDWSYNLLAAAEQQLFARLAVFMGGWTLEAAEAVCNADGALPLDVLDGLASLLDKSLLQQVEAPKGYPDGEPRFIMLETIREYALERLEVSGEAEAIRRAHAEYYLALAERAEVEVGGSLALVIAGLQSPSWLKQLAAEHDNLRAALAWTLEHHAIELALPLAGALGWFWQAHGLQREGRRWLTQALPFASAVPPSVQAKALLAAGGLALGPGDLKQAQGLLEASLALFRHLGDTPGIAVAHCGLGYMALFHGEYDRAQRLVEVSVALFRDLGDIRGIAAALQLRGLIALDAGKLEQAQELLEESLALFRDLGDQAGIAACDALGWALLYRGDAGRARLLLEEFAALLYELDDKSGIVNALRGLAFAAYEEGDYAQAQSLMQESLTLLHQQGNESGVGSANKFEMLARVAAAQQQPERAARLFGAAEALREAIGLPLSPAERSHYYDRTVAALHAELGEAAFAAAWAEGRAMSLEQAIAYALAERD